MPDIAYYVKKIKDDDQHLTTINLSKQAITNETFALIQEAYANNPAAALRLTKLLLGQNSITRLKLVGMSGLKELNVSSNPLEELEFEGALSLKKLYLSKTKVKLPKISGMLDLKVLSLIDAEVIGLDLTNSPMISNVDLRGNKLSLASKISIQTVSAKHAALTVMLNHLQSVANVRALDLPALTIEMLHAHFSQALKASLQTKVPIVTQHILLALYKAAKNTIPKEIAAKILAFDHSNEILATISNETSGFRRAFTPYFVGVRRYGFDHNQQVVAAYLQTKEYKELLSRAQASVSKYIECLTWKLAKPNP
jgi:hypothetical protein